MWALLVHIRRASRRVVRLLCAILVMMLLSWLFQGGLAYVDDMLQVGVEFVFITLGDSLDGVESLLLSARVEPVYNTRDFWGAGRVRRVIRLVVCCSSASHTLWHRIL